MPIFEYRCRSCGKVIEVLENRSEKAAHTCPSCGKTPMERIFSSFGVDKGSSSSGGACPPGGSCPTGTCPYG